MIPFDIQANDFLSTDVQAYYHVRYTRMGNEGNPDYLNDLKNTYNNFSQTKLQGAVNELGEVLQNDVQEIYQILGFDKLTVCVVPRAKAEKEYQKTQQLFRWTVQAVIREVNGLIDGTDYINRHTNTRTTHLSHKPIPNYNNDGEMPYPGITEETCEISPNVRGENILLIDDIYTPDVNIDEDAINALLKAGARTVTFYAVGKV